MPRKKNVENTLQEDRTQIVDAEYSDVMQKSYIDYSMSVIISRAVPDIRDGLKPVQRRVLYDMHALGIGADKPYRKSARIVGDTMGKFHPHGDSSIYDSLVVMSQDFKKGAPLVDGHGNFGSIEGDTAAAMRYTESRLQTIAQDALLHDLGDNTVDFVPNFDENEKEPSVLPARFSNFLVNGSEGIAVGMTTSTPPHNLAEVVDGMIAIIKNPKIGLDDLLQIIPGPDFPTGGIVVNKSDLTDIYKNGSGKIKIRGKATIEKSDNGRERIVITEIPYTMIGANIGKFLNDIATLIENRTTTDIMDISNQSAKEGIRIVIELKKGADAKNIINMLYKKTKLEDTFGVNMLAIANGRPEIVGLKEALKYSVDFQYDILTRKYFSLLRKAMEKSEIEEGLILACGCIDTIIEILRGSKDRKQAKDCLTTGKAIGISFKSKTAEKRAAKLSFSSVQADAILDMRLYRLIGLEIESLQKEHEKTLKDISKYKAILDDRKVMSKQIINDLSEIKTKYGRARRTVIKDAKEAVFKAAKPKDTECVVLVDRFGYIKAIDPQTYERNKAVADEENRFIFSTRTNSKVVIFTEEGSAHSIPVVDIPLGKVRDKGKPIDNLSSFSVKNEHIVFATSLDVMNEKFVFFCTELGLTKMVPAKEYAVSKRTVAATKLQKGDRVIAMQVADKQDFAVFITRNGWAVKTKLNNISVQKRASIGVAAMSLTESDKIETAFVISKKDLDTADTETLKAIASLKTSGRATKGSHIFR